MFSQVILPRTAPGLKKRSLHISMLRVTLGLVLLTLVTGSKCPNQDLCGEQETCCQKPSGENTCCPFHQGECCEDHLHCCPEGMLCQVMKSKCSNRTHSLPWAERRPVQRTDLSKSFRMVSASTARKDTTICPDESSCPAEFSCLLQSNAYGCCPVTKGIVCSDGKHCCPDNHQCSTDSTSCVKKKEPIQALVCADGLSECPVGTSCCETADGAWSCCPVPRAVCCADKVHCCPEDSVCHVNSSKCVSSTKEELPMWAKFPARLRADWENRRSVSRTAKTTTTPERTKVSESPAGVSSAVSKGSNVPCDGTWSCPDNTTCCKTEEGSWACCPLPQAVCCEDHIHCCPHGKKCNLAAATCEDPSGSVPWLKKELTLLIRRQKVPETKGSDVPCDGTWSCPDNTTCCKTEEGSWACCPLPQAVCCEDHIHCCPHGKKCNLAAATCEDPSGSVPWLKKDPTLLIRQQKVPETKGSNVPCDGTWSCPDNTTCCKTEEGSWACCPLPQAVCCEDHIHCCPHGKKCNLAAATCEDPSGSVPWLKKELTLLIRRQKVPETKGSDVPCDGTWSCPDNTTCCKTEEGSWACCPLPQAVCCEDHIHCCPHGKKCNLAAATCEDPSGSVPWLKKDPTLLIRQQKVPETKGSDVPCDGTWSCPDNTTCCKTEEGSWACCPLPQAVCCEDHIHCCPHGKKCNLAAATCEDPSGSVPWLKKEPSQPRADQKPLVKGPKSSGNISCDSTHYCLNSTTCCKGFDANWNCCPFPQGVCCEDQVHCCPQDATCNSQTLTCNKGNSSIPMALMRDAPSHQPQEKKKPLGKEEHGRVQCDKHTSCPDHTTCCFIHKTQKWGCCPLTKAVCCEDGEHCCPEQYKCDKSQTTCVKGDVVVPWYTKLPAQSSPAPDLGHGSLACDAHTTCSVGHSCCKLSTGQWGCCPLPQATCCSDGEHCCPAGYSCDVDSGSCVKTIWLQVETVPLTHINNQQKDIQCGGGFSCPDAETCCKTSQATWGCCPLAKAVCCDDMKHCCPAGFTCVEGGVCAQAAGFSWDNWQVFFSKKKRAAIL